MNGDGDCDVNSSGPEAHLVVASLIVKLASHRCRSSLCVLGCPKLGFNFESAGKNSKSLTTDLDILRLRISNRLRLERAASPRELQWNDKFVFRLIAIDVQARLDYDFQLLFNAGARLYADLFYRADPELILLC